MTSALSPRARSEYAATVVSSFGHRHGRIARALGTVRSATARIHRRPSSVGTLAVIRRTDGAFVVNVDAGTRSHADHLLHLVREQLATMTVAQFERAWGIDRHVDRLIQRHLDGDNAGPVVAPVAGRRALRSAG
jgi:hypothetical protein